MATVEFQLHDIGELLSWIDAQGEAGKKAVSNTIKDIKSRAPGWIASETAAVYNIKKTEITPAKTEENRKKKAVSISTSGGTLETVSIVYRGRTLTPIHFSMTPKMPRKQKKYSISFEVFKGNRMKIRGRYLTTPFLAPVKRGSDKYIAFQRKSIKRTDMESIRTVSVPQMLGNSKVQSGINEKIIGSVEQRLQHHLDRFAPKG